LDEGTGIVHLAPAYGEEDFALAKEDAFPVVSNIDDNGFYTSGEWKGKHVWETNKEIAKTLHERGVVWKIEYIVHSYPHCYRCGTRLMYRAHPSWFLDIASQRERMLEENGNINWFPEHIKRGRFQKNVEAAPDWNLSRDRFWATALPVWKGTDKEGKEHIKVIGSYAELKELSGVELEDYHRPWIDAVEFDLEGVHYKRIDKVIDCWFESGSMPFAQFHYPFENVDKFEKNFPGDFIVEYIGQVRAWFYYLHAVSVGLFDKQAFKNVIATGTLAGNDGRKMSKSYGNYTDPNELMDKYSADALRFLLLSSPLSSGEDFSLIDKDVADVARKLSMIWNMFDFFTLYAEVDKWEWDGKLEDPYDSLTNPLDVWIVSRVHELTKQIEANMEAYNLPEALKPVLPFIDDASNWYVRRSRRRFWKSSNDSDKQDAYKTLHYVLVRLSVVLAPFVPFLAEELYQKLTAGESVHLLDWPVAGRQDELVLQKMAYVRDVINQGLSERAAAGIKVRQPLGDLFIKGAPAFFESIEDDYLSIIKEELNVKSVFANTHEASQEVTLDLTITPELRREGMAREVVRNIQSARKQAGLDVDDRISLSVSTTDDELRRAIEEYKEAIVSETLATKLVFDHTYSFESACTVDDAPLTVSLQKA
jgi:isoleucyl-tRNA synthetase